jgi:enoyl-CoA hydratase/carnithine racemase
MPTLPKYCRLTYPLFYLAYGLSLAETIAKKSPIAIHGIKQSVLYARDHSVDDGLRQIATWNGHALQATDMIDASASLFTKKEPIFPKL